MTTEDDFQHKLNRTPEDWQTRLVFADWLRDRNDPRADGYQMLGTRRLWPCPWRLSKTWTSGAAKWQWWNGSGKQPASIRHHIVSHTLPGCVSRVIGSHGHKTRREAEDAVALAFATLPAELRVELLAVEVSAPKPRTRTAGKKPRKSAAKQPKGKKK